MADPANTENITRVSRIIFYSFLIGLVSYFILKCLMKDRVNPQLEAEKYSLIIGALAIIYMAIYGTGVPQMTAQGFR